MGITWTGEQEKVIKLRDRNLLVSAAAGSGKTAVLVERICRRVMDMEHPCNIDELLVVTFTKAAAAEMRNRISDSLEKYLEQDPENTHLQKQVVLSRNAQITTIDGFCLNFLKEHFYLLDIEPGFMVMDDNEKKLLVEDVMDRVLNDYYKARTPEFIQFVENYCTGKKDKELSDFIYSMYINATSHPWPKQWLRECVEAYRQEDIENHPLVQAILRESRCVLEDAVKALEETIEDISTISEFEKLYLDLTKMKDDVKEVLTKKGFEELGKAVREFHAVNMPRITCKDPVLAEVKDEVKKVREWVKNQIKDMAGGYFLTDSKKLSEECQKVLPMATLLCEMTEVFMDALAKEKQKINRVDFNDIEHMVLSILMDEDGNVTDLAKESRKQYQEIMIDEYQDSNLLQEYILTAISTCDEGKNNIFMVGDVKQSIYRFRLARPDMFVNKYNAYTLEDSPKQKILLDCNFRSRKEVLGFCNDVFHGLMQEDLGDIAYDEAAELKVGADYVQPEEDLFTTQVHFVDETSFEGQGLTKEEMESMAIAQCILREVREGMVTDKATGELRPTRFEDIVVLSRSAVWWDTLKEVLRQQNIPAIITGNTGYFNSLEIILALSFLQVIDNRMQDVPLVTVLTSVIGGMSKDEVARIRARYPKMAFCKACVGYAEEADEVLDDNEKEIKCKLNKLFDRIADYKRRAGYEPVYELLEEIYEETRLYEQMGVLAQGNIRMQNLDMLIEKAYTFENTSYHGLYHFLRYIRQIQKYEIDFPISGDDMQANGVRIMTIHKSKGLEFPVVIVSALSRQFNTSDTKARLITHPEYGAALEVTDGYRRIRRRGFFKHGLKAMVHKENLAEEIRVLYVALTRAKERLILTGAIKNPDQLDRTLEKYQNKRYPLSYSDKIQGRSYMDWLIKILAPYQNKYLFEIITSDLLNAELINEKVRNAGKKPWFMDEKAGEENAQALEDITGEFDYAYRYDALREIPLKMSVSDIKHRVMEEIFLNSEHKVEEIVPEFLKDEKKKTIPMFLSGEVLEEVNQGALRGTAFHRVLECMDFSEEKWMRLTDRGALDEEVHKELERQVEAGLISASMADLIYIGKVSNFLRTDLFGELHQASKAGLLRKEQPFVMGITPQDAAIVVPKEASEATILVQGIIDVFYEKDGKITLLDYKTDKVSAKDELVMRYKKQMELYKEAIERATHKEVGRIVLYSFSLEEVVDVEI